MKYFLYFTSRIMAAMNSTVDEELSNVYASLFNSEEMHDRILVFEPLEKEVRSGYIEEVGIEKQEQDKIVEEPENLENEKEEKGVEILQTNESQEIKNDGDMEKTNGQMGQSRRRDEGIEENASASTNTFSSLFVHSVLLAKHSSYFKTLFHGHFKEAQLREVTMKIHPSELKSHLMLIQAMYQPGVLKIEDHNLLLDILVLAQKYEANMVAKKCKSVLVSCSLTLEKCEDIVKRVEKMEDCSNVLSAMKKFLVNEFSPLDEAAIIDKFKELSETLLRILLPSDDLVVRSEDTVFHCLMKWIDYNIPESERSTFLPQSSLLSLVRFEFMSGDFLYDIVQNNASAKVMPGFAESLQKGFIYNALSQGRRQHLETSWSQRSSYKNTNSLFSWVINNSVREELLNPNTDGAFSEGFWFMGYNMSLVLFYSDDGIGFTVWLDIDLDDSEELYLEVSWTLKSDLFKNGSATMTRQIYRPNDHGLDPIAEECLVPLAMIPAAMAHRIDVCNIVLH